MKKYIYLILICSFFQELNLQGQIQPPSLKKQRINYIQISPTRGKFVTNAVSDMAGRYTTIFNQGYKFGAAIETGVERSFCNKPEVFYSIAGSTFLHRTTLFKTQIDYIALLFKVGLLKENKAYRFGCFIWTSNVILAKYDRKPDPILENAHKWWGGLSWQVNKLVSNRFNLLFEVNHGLTVIKSVSRNNILGGYLSDEKHFPLWMSLGFRFYPQRWAK